MFDAGATYTILMVLLSSVPISHWQSHKQVSIRLHWRQDIGGVDGVTGDAGLKAGPDG